MFVCKQVGCRAGGELEIMKKHAQHVHGVKEVPGFKKYIQCDACGSVYIRTAQSTRPHVGSNGCAQDALRRRNAEVL